jgi:hypothetical protein
MFFTSLPHIFCLNLRRKMIMRTFEINFAVNCPDGVDADTLADLFVEFVENNGWSCGGGVRELDEDGNPVED